MGTAIRETKFTGKTLAAWRERMGYSKADAARALGCHHNSISNWEDSSYPVPRYISLACAALALGMTPYGELRKDDGAKS